MTVLLLRSVEIGGITQTILASSIKEVWIDSSKGVDVAAGSVVVTEVESEAQIEVEMGEAAAVQRVISPVSMAVEMEKAQKICAQAKRAVMHMFQEARMGNAVDASGAKQMVAEISDSVSRNPGALISLARLKTADDYTYMHSVAVCAMMVALARQVGLDEEQTRLAGLAGLMHDLGKAAMPMEVLNKPGKLTDAEFAIIKTHPVEGYQLLLSGKDVDAVVLDVCLHHHEKTDGSGYPKGLKADEISLQGRIIAIADAYCTMTTERPYCRALTEAEAIKEIKKCAGLQFDENLARLFVEKVLQQEWPPS